MRCTLSLLKMAVVWSTCLTWLLPLQAIHAAGQASGGAPSGKGSLGDVRLDAEGTLRGKMVDGQGQPLAGRPLRLVRSGQLVSEATTGKDGEFAFSDLRGGVYQVYVAKTVVTCRVWTCAVAPPVARQQLLLVDAPELVRGQQPIGAIFTNPLFLGLLVAAAIAIPIAVHNSQDDPVSGS